MALTIIALAILVIVVIWWFFFRTPRPEISPLTVDKNEPLMIEAIQSAKESIDNFIDLFRQYPNDSQVKVPFITSSGKTEFLWAEAKGIKESEITVFLITPPVTHTEQVNRTQTYQLADIVDWVVFQNNGKAKGGYTMKVMFKIAKEKWGQLPPKLQEEEKKYI
jgi:uncharacterized protein YegJ (DUF2314 family)